MKKYVFHVAVLMVLALAGGTYSASAQIYVHVRPVAPVIVRTERPGPRHVWIGEEWETRDGVYVHTGGHWAEPPHAGWIWVPGHWRHHPRGEYWVPGHWARR